MEIKEFLRKNKITQARFAKSIGISESMFSYVLNKKRRMSPELATVIQKITQGKVKAYELVFGSSEKKSI